MHWTPTQLNARDLNQNLILIIFSFKFPDVSVANMGKKSSFHCYYSQKKIIKQGH